MTMSKYPLHQKECEEQELTSLSFWNETPRLSPKKISSFKWLGAGLMVILLGIIGFLVFLLHEKSSIPTAEVIISAPEMPHKIAVQEIQPEEESLVYQRTNPNPTPKPKKKPIVAEDTYYIVVDRFSRQDQALQRFRELKRQYPAGMKGVTPLLRMHPSEEGTTYELLIGPVDRKTGSQRCELFGGKTRLISAAE